MQKVVLKRVGNPPEIIEVEDAMQYACQTIYQTGLEHGGQLDDYTRQYFETIYIKFKQNGINIDRIELGQKNLNNESKPWTFIYTASPLDCPPKTSNFNFEIVHLVIGGFCDRNELKAEDNIHGDAVFLNCRHWPDKTDYSGLSDEQIQAILESFKNDNSKYIFDAAIFQRKLGF